MLTPFLLNVALAGDVMILGGIAKPEMMIEK
jgi:hypothetical protein